jgi:prolyl 4-hydroxylase
LKDGKVTRPLNDDWREWLRLNFDRDCAVDELFQRAARQDFDPEEIARELGGYRPAEIVPAAANEPGRPSSATGTAAGVGATDGEPWRSLYQAPLTKPENTPRAWRLDTDLAQVYEIPEFLTNEECEAMITVIDASLRRSTTTRGPSDYRTSRTCDMRRAKPEMIESIDQRLANLVGCGVDFSEPMQGQRYDVGQYFKAHTDWFAPQTKEYDIYTKGGGQRTWTIMVYLNDVEEGGVTRFERVGRDFRPVKGLAIAWNNLNADGTTNPATLHEAIPVTRGKKYVITKWFREQSGLNV